MKLKKKAITKKDKKKILIKRMKVKIKIKNSLKSKQKFSIGVLNWKEK